MGGHAEGPLLNWSPLDRKASSSALYRNVCNGPGISVTGFSQGFPDGVLWEKHKRLSSLSGLYETFQKYKAFLSLPQMT